MSAFRRYFLHVTRVVHIWLGITLSACVVRGVMELPDGFRWADTIWIHALAIAAAILFAFPPRVEGDTKT